MARYPRRGWRHARHKCGASLLENPAVDMVCRGEGEAVITDLLLNPFGDFDGIVGRNRADSGRSTPLIYDLDTISILPGICCR